MFRKLLIANRAEIAVRVIRACRDLDVSPVAIYSDLDIDSLHARMADEAYKVGPGPAAESYLNIPAILEAATRSGAEAVHPGYGFLAENGAFARAVIEAGLCWVGPAPEVIEAMGDKITARRLAMDAGVPSVPGTRDPIGRAEDVSSFAAEHGLPVAIKASAGGGGKGFRVVHDVSEIEQALAGAIREARAYFSSEEVYLERYLERPRHIEVQVLADSSGAIVSFPERDCSLQRRHQKLVEESPSPALARDVREAMMEAAARIAKQVGYHNAGTCEFLLDSDAHSFYFLEMNTRLQVEHPVTELVTGQDLVRAQLLIAAGEPLETSPEDLGLSGHAIECRINAEDPGQGFMPTPGSITSYKEPAGPGVRVDSGVEEGSEVPQAYDPLIAKVIASGATREQARKRMLRALGEYEIEGIATTIPFHAEMIDDPRFASSSYHTATVETEMDLSVLAPARAAPLSGRAGVTSERRFTLEVNGKRFSIRAREHADPGYARRKPEPPATVGAVGPGASEVLSAPMRGTIVEVLVAQGQEVRAGDAICVLEAMKMENRIAAHADGTIEELKVEAGQAVEPGSALAVIR